MDTLTHALAGAVIARIYTGRERGGFTPGRWTWLGAGAAAFPDVDIVALAAGPLEYLAFWHRGPTHSLLLWPLWSAALAGAVGWRRRKYLDLGILFALALLSHIALDVITVYGTQVFFPLSRWRAALGTTFILDPVVSAALVVGLVLALARRSASPGAWALGIVLVWVGLQGAMKLQARGLAEAWAKRTHVAAQAVAALPQPGSPALWKLVVMGPENLHVAYVDLWSSRVRRIDPGAGRVARWLAHYRPRAALRWTALTRFGGDPATRRLAAAAWHQPALALYRAFARFPRLYRIDRRGAGTCVWFVDARFELPELTPPFRYGVCRRGPSGAWRLQRLPRSSASG